MKEGTSNRATAKAKNFFRPVQMLSSGLYRQGRDRRVIFMAGFKRRIQQAAVAYIREGARFRARDRTQGGNHGGVSLVGARPSPSNQACAI